MDSLVSELLSQPSEGVDNYLSKLRSKSDLIAGAAAQSMNHSTALLEALKEVSVSHCTAGYALFLSLQAEALPDAASASFLSVSNQFFTAATKSSVCFVADEGPLFDEHY